MTGSSSKGSRQTPPKVVPSSSSSSSSNDNDDKNNNNNNNNFDTVTSTNTTKNNNDDIDQGTWTIGVGPSKQTTAPSRTVQGIASTAATVLLPNVGILIRQMLTVAIALYILNQEHLLPKPLSSIVSRVLFWPTLPITVGKRYQKWYTPIDDTVIMGGAPFGFTKIPETLYNQYNVRGVINLCEEYQGPIRTYNKLGIRQLYLPTTDHFEPSIDSIQDAIEFILEHQKRKECVYVHCRAGHGRSAAIVLIWLLISRIGNNVDPASIDLKDLNEELCQLRNVRKTLYQQPNIKQFHSMIIQQYNVDNGEDDEEIEELDDREDDNSIRTEYDGDTNDSSSDGLDVIDSSDIVDDDNDDDSQQYSFTNIEDEL